MLRTATRRDWVTDILTVLDGQASLASHWVILPLPLRTPKGSTWSVPQAMPWRQARKLWKPGDRPTVLLSNHKGKCDCQAHVHLDALKHPRYQTWTVWKPIGKNLQCLQNLESIFVVSSWDLRPLREAFSHCPILEKLVFRWPRSGIVGGLSQAKLWNRGSQGSWETLVEQHFSEGQAADTKCIFKVTQRSFFGRFESYLLKYLHVSTII